MPWDARGTGRVRSDKMEITMKTYGIAAQACAFLGFCLAATSWAAPLEEIRMGSLGSRGVVFTEEWPGTFSKAVSGAGDVNGDGWSDVLLLHYDASADYRPSVFLVYGKKTLPETIPASELKGFAT